MKYIDEIDLSEKRVFVRVDFNVPVASNVVTDDTRIRAALPTIRYALGQNAKVILASHRGRPGGKANEELSMKPVGVHLSHLLDDIDILMPASCADNSVRKLVADMLPGQIILLENLRFHPGEEKNDPDFAKELAANVDVYINEAFGTAHRAHASTAGMAKFIETRGAGFLMRQEIKYLSQLIDTPEKPFIAMLGGAKVADKLGVLENLLNKVDALLIGGGMAYTFLKAQGVEVGTSLVDNTKLHSAKRILERASTRGISLLLPVDHIVAPELSDKAITSKTEDSAIPAGVMALDIGPKTCAHFAECLKGAKTIFWNGPMGVFEIDAFAQGTVKLAKAVAKSEANTVIGGGDSIAAINQAKVADQVNHISTGGGASLEFIEGKKLPGLEALEN